MDQLSKTQADPKDPAENKSQDTSQNTGEIKNSNTRPNSTINTSALNTKETTDSSTNPSGETTKNNINEKEFAKKPPFIKRETVKKYALIGGGAIFLISLLITTFAIIKKHTTPQPEEPKPKPEITVEPEKPAEVELPIFAYVKNDREIWTANSDGKKRTMITEAPFGSKATALNFKDKYLLSYSICEEQKSCNINTIDLKNKALSSEASIKDAYIRKFAFSKDKNYLAYISANSKITQLQLKSGTIVSSLNSFETQPDDVNLDSRVFFTPNGQYVIFATLRKDVIKKENKREEPKVFVYPIIYVYRVNGAKVDEIKDASDPFLVGDDSIGYRKENAYFYKTIGTTEFTEITQTQGLHPVISFDKKKIAYWQTEDFDQNIVLGLYELDKGIHRNILRGVVSPTWITNDKIIGVKVDSCLGETCLLYQFKTASVGIIDITSGNIKLLDQAKSISEVVTNAN